MDAAGLAMTHVRRLLLLVMLCCSAATHGQGGPPMATDDPGTPGDGHWEINLAAVGTHAGNTWAIDAPDADINYGVGERLQLNLDLPWTFTNAAGGWKSAIGATSIGVKWRFLDNEETDGLALSTYPRFVTSLSSRAERIGVASPDKEFFLPIEAAMKIQSFDVAADLGRHFIEHENSFWSAGMVVGHSCGTEKVQCLVELHREWRPEGSQTLLNFGLHWKLNDSMVVLAAAGREFGTHNEDQTRALLYLGVQILR